jgi:hypothetical protein
LGELGGGWTGTGGPRQGGSWGVAGGVGKA